MDQPEVTAARKPPWLPLSRSVIVAAAVVGASLIGARGCVEALRVHHQEGRITVTGSATKRIKSDFIVWRARIRSQNPTMTEAYKKLALDLPQVLSFIKQRGIGDTQITVSSVMMQELHPRDQQGMMQEEITVAYVAEQAVEVSSNEIAKVEKVSREATQLFDSGIYVSSEPPLYIYTQLGELKIQMLAEASKDAKLRAEQVALNTGSKLGGLITARMGVMQINPAFSTEVSAEGNNDKTSLEKDVLAVVTASFQAK
jgi:hypothetical protein